MTTTPADDRAQPPWRGDERTTLEGFLDYHRDTLLWKCAGLSPEQLAMRSVPSTNLSLLGLVRHLAEVERSWFRRRFAAEDAPPIWYTEDEQDRDIDPPPDADADADLAAYRAEVETCRAVAAAHGLDETFATGWGETSTLRWIYVHMIEEYARHNGHADLLREAIDGATGE